MYPAIAQPNLFQTRRPNAKAQQRVVNILDSVYALRLATPQQITTLHPSPTPTAPLPRGQFRGGLTAIEKLMRGLYKDDFLRRPNIPEVYTLGRQGAKLLAQQKGYDYNLLDKHLHLVGKYKVYFTDHRLGVNDFRVVLTAALRDQPGVQVSNWLEPTLQNQFKIKVKVKNRQTPKIAHRSLQLGDVETTIVRAPDAAFNLTIIKNGQPQTIGILYEKDRGTESHHTIAAKLTCYLHWQQQRLHEELFRTNQLRILIETENQTRMTNMINRAALPTRIVKGQPTGKGIFWFTTKDNITLQDPSKILEPIWTVGHINHREQKHSLLEI